MEFVVERKGYYRENEEEEEEEEEEDDNEDEDGEEIGSSIISKFPFSSSSSSSSKAYNNNNDYNYKRRQIGDDIDEEVVVGTRCYINMNYKKQDGGGIEGRESRDQLGGDHAQEREHMFDKVVTPSDVGKLNRLVIPKQHAEKYFPLHSSASSSGPEKSGALLDFEDRNGKQWRFRYSYWNSSQSYVMTKGWSRFVKEKKLDAGDIVSFHRSLTTTTIPAAAAAADHEELGGGGGGGGGGGRPKYRLFIDWKHRSPIQQHIPVIPPPPHGSSWGYNNHHHHQQMTQMMNYNQFQPYFDHHRHSYNYGHQRSATLMGAPAAGSNIYYLTPSQPRLINIMGGSNHHHHDDDDDDQTVINSVPVQLLHPMNPPPPPPPHPPTPTSTSTSTSTNSSSASPKRLRLFGVNMEEHCFPIQTDHHHQQQQHHVLPSVPYFTNISHLPKASSSYNVSSTTPPTLLPKSPNTTTTTTTTSSLSFDLHLSDSH